jgi:hypothetical protein
MVHRVFELRDLLHGHGKQEGWYDSPDKVPGSKKAMAAEAAVKAATAHTISPEPAGPAKRGPGRPRKNP